MVDPNPVRTSGSRSESEGENSGMAAYRALKSRIHRQILDRMDLAVVESLGEAALRQAISAGVENLLAASPAPINEVERRLLVRDIQNEMLGLGVLEQLMADPSVSDILCNSARQVYVERHGRLELTAVRFDDDAHLMRIIERIVSRVGRRIDESSPMVDARLPDGSRVNAIIPPIAIDGPSLSIRRFAAVPLRMDELIHEHGSLSAQMASFLETLVRGKVNMLISGGTGSGKTTLLNILSGFIDPAERVVTIEDAAELQLRQPHVVRLETRPPNVEGQGEVTQRALVRNALRMRPDRIIVGEVRGAEVVDMLQAMNTGHEGSLTTIHANTARDGLGRLESMLGMSGINLPHEVGRQQIASAIGVMIQANRLSDGGRRITSIQEVTGMEGEVICMQEIFRFRQQGVDTQGHVLGCFESTGIRPSLAERLAARGLPLSPELFAPGVMHD